MTNIPSDPLRRFLTRVEFDAIFHVSHSKGYKLRAMYGVEIIKSGMTNLIPITEIDRIVAVMPRGVSSTLMRPAIAAKRVKHEARQASK
jgi:hypothetical protein